MTGRKGKGDDKGAEVKGYIAFHNAYIGVIRLALLSSWLKGSSLLSL